MRVGSPCRCEVLGLRRYCPVALLGWVTVASACSLEPDANAAHASEKGEVGASITLVDCPSDSAPPDGIEASDIPIAGSNRVSHGLFFFPDSREFNLRFPGEGPRADVVLSASPSCRYMRDEATPHVIIFMGKTHEAMVEGVNYTNSWIEYYRSESDSPLRWYVHFQGSDSGSSKLSPSEYEKRFAPLPLSCETDAIGLAEALELIPICVDVE